MLSYYAVYTLRSSRHGLLCDGNHEVYVTYNGLDNLADCQIDATSGVGTCLGHKYPPQRTIEPNEINDPRVRKVFDIP